MSYTTFYYYNQPNHNNFFDGLGIIIGTATAANILRYCPLYVNNFTEIYVIGLSASFYYTVYISYNNKYRNTFLSDFKNSLFITMCGSLVYHHLNYNSS